MSFFNSLFENDNKINEGNIIIFIATIMFVVIDTVALCFSNLNNFLVVFFLGLVAEHMLFIFFMNKTENSKFEAKDVLNSLEKVAVESVKK